MTGAPKSDVKVNCSEVVVASDPSTAATCTAKLPSEFGVPEIRPAAASRLNPEGRPLTLNCVAGLPPDVSSWKLNGCPVLPVALLLLIIVSVEAGCTVVFKFIELLP